jgi:hypothetical protein
MTPKTRAARIGLEVALWSLTALLVTPSLFGVLGARCSQRTEEEETA